jgi:hypothetical protein
MNMHCTHIYMYTCTHTHPHISSLVWQMNFHMNLVALQSYHSNTLWPSVANEHSRWERALEQAGSASDNKAPTAVPPQLSGKRQEQSGYWAAYPAPCKWTSSVEGWGWLTPELRVTQQNAVLLRVWTTWSGFCRVQLILWPISGCHWGDCWVLVHLLPPTWLSFLLLGQHFLHRKVPRLHRPEF